MPDFDPFSAMVVDEPTALEMAKARAAALRGQNYAGLVMGLAHDPQSAKVGGELAQQAQTGLTDLGGLPGERLKQAMGQVKLGQAQREAAPYTDPAQSALLSQGQQAAARSFGGVLPEGASPATGNILLQAMEKAAAIPKFTGASYGTTGTIDTRTGKYTPIPGASGGGMGSYTPEAIDVLARKGNATGKIELPPGVRGPGAMALGSAVLKRMVELNPQGDLAGAAAGYHADTASLANQQKMLDNAESWERTGTKNLDVLLGIAQKLHDTGSPWLNRPVRAFFEKGIGDPNQAAFKTAHAAVVNEYAKILSGSQGSGAVTEGAHKEAESMFPLDATMDQWIASGNVLRTDARNRIGSMREQAGQTKARAGGRQVAPVAEAPLATSTSAPDPKLIAHYRASLQPGERLAMNAQGKAKALKPGDAVPEGFTEVQ